MLKSLQVNASKFLTLSVPQTIIDSPHNVHLILHSSALESSLFSEKLKS